MPLVAPPVDVEIDEDESGKRILSVELADGKLHRLPMSVQVDEDALKCRFDRGKSLLYIEAPITGREEDEEDEEAEPKQSATDPESDYDSDSSPSGTPPIGWTLARPPDLGPVSIPTRPPPGHGELTPSTSSPASTSDTLGQRNAEEGPEGDHIFDPLFRIPPEKANPALKLTQIPGAGKGYIARAKIRRGESILIEKSITPSDPSEDQRDAEGLIARLCTDDPAAFKQLLLDIEGMVPAAEEIPTMVREEAKTAMAGQGVAVNEDVIRLYAVFKCNAFEGGLYPHMARFNHSCNPSCRYRHKAGRIEAWARRDIPQGEQVTISYRNCESRFPGLPWDVCTQRKSNLRSYLFECRCELCTQGSPGVESVLCNQNGGCKGEIRPTFDGTLSQCDLCGGRLKSADVWSGGGTVVAFVREMEKAFQEFRQNSSHTRQCLALLRQCDGTYRETRKLLHPHHLALYRLRALLVDLAQHIKADPVVQFDDSEFSALMVDCLTHLDQTAIHLHGELDLMRLPILKMKEAFFIHQRMIYGPGPALEEQKREQEQAIAALGPPHVRFLCSSCGAQAACSLELLSCGKCGNARYCNKACQKGHWKAHKKGCGNAQ